MVSWKRLDSDNQLKTTDRAAIERPFSMKGTEMSASKHPAQGPSKPTRHQQKPAKDEVGGSGHIHAQREKLFRERDNPDVTQRVTNGRNPLWKPEP